MPWPTFEDWKYTGGVKRFLVWAPNGSPIVSEGANRVAKALTDRQFVPAITATGIVTGSGGSLLGTDFIARGNFNTIINPYTRPNDVYTLWININSSNPDTTGVSTTQEADGTDENVIRVSSTESYTDNQLRALIAGTDWKGASVYVFLSSNKPDPADAPLNYQATTPTTITALNYRSVTGATAMPDNVYMIYGTSTAEMATYRYGLATTVGSLTYGGPWLWAAALKTLTDANWNISLRNLILGIRSWYSAQSTAALVTTNPEPTYTGPSWNYTYPDTGRTVTWYNTDIMARSTIAARQPVLACQTAAALDVIAFTPATTTWVAPVTNNKKKAVLIGNQSYGTGNGANAAPVVLDDGLTYYGPPLEARNDVAIMYDLLIKRGYAASDIHLHYGETGATDVTRDAIMERLAWLNYGRTAGDEVLFYYSGHGFESILTNNANESDGRDEMIQAHNANVRGNEINNALNNPASQSKAIIILDACHNGTVSDRSSIYRAINDWTWVVPEVPGTQKATDGSDASNPGYTYKGPVSIALYTEANGIANGADPPGSAMYWLTGSQDNMTVGNDCFVDPAALPPCPTGSWIIEGSASSYPGTVKLSWVSYCLWKAYSLSSFSKIAPRDMLLRIKNEYNKDAYPGCVVNRQIAMKYPHFACTGTCDPRTSTDVAWSLL